MNRLTLFTLICLAASCCKIDPEQKTDYGTPYGVLTIANWFVEEAGFPAYPDNGAESSPAGVGY